VSDGSSDDKPHADFFEVGEVVVVGAKVDEK
jgi:hypothetical protein